MAAALSLGAAASPQTPPPLEGVPRYDHVAVIVEENKDYAQILGGAAAPHIAQLARRYGVASRFYSEVHPSEANYVALLAGDTFGIFDDDAWYCRPHSKRPWCEGSELAAYPDHTVRARHLGDQLAARGLSWKGYYESLPAPGSDAIYTGDPRFGTGAGLDKLYASKHSGFINFADVLSDPRRAEKIVGFDQLDRDLAAGQLPNFALIVPNQCNEMHGLSGPGVPGSCDSHNKPGLIRRGDAHAGELVRRLQATAAWRGPSNMAIIVTFDEGADPSVHEGCCGITPGAPSNFGGGHIPTVVITNHGPRAVSDNTPYSHYSMLRTLEDAFGIAEHLGHAAETDKGVVPMVKLFATSTARR